MDSYKILGHAYSTHFQGVAIMLQQFSVEQGWMIIGFYGLIMFAVTWFFSRHFTKTKDLFLVASRKVGLWQSSVSIAATWIWAPALFIAAQKAYQQGIAGTFWFTVPNIACLIVFGWFAKKMRDRLPDGYTLSDFARKQFSSRVHNLYIFQLTGLAICSFAVQLLAGGAVITALTGIPFLWVTIALAGISLIYSLFSGLNASIVTDFVQLGFIYIVSIVLVPWAIINGGGFDALVRGLGGVTGTYGSIFSGDGGQVFLTVGIAVTIGLMAGPFGDQSFWQRTFA
ncbi:MAG: sodium:solute symporter family transporter, partial [Bacteroidota bacterium]